LVWGVGWCDLLEHLCLLVLFTLFSSDYASDRTTNILYMGRSYMVFLVRGRTSKIALLKVKFIPMSVWFSWDAPSVEDSVT
jgi:hypothetical protein